MLTPKPMNKITSWKTGGTGKFNARIIKIQPRAVSKNKRVKGFIYSLQSLFY